MIITAGASPTSRSIGLEDCEALSLLRSDPPVTHPYECQKLREKNKNNLNMIPLSKNKRGTHPFGMLHEKLCHWRTGNPSRRRDGVAVTPVPLLPPDIIWMCVLRHCARDWWNDKVPPVTV